MKYVPRPNSVRTLSSAPEAGLEAGQDPGQISVEPTRVARVAMDPRPQTLEAHLVDHCGERRILVLDEQRTDVVDRPTPLQGTHHRLRPRISGRARCEYG